MRCRPSFNTSTRCVFNTIHTYHPRVYNVQETGLRLVSQRSERIPSLYGLDTDLPVSLDHKTSHNEAFCFGQMQMKSEKHNDRLIQQVFDNICNTAAVNTLETAYQASF